MPTLDIFSSSVKYRFRTNLCSCGTLFVLIAITLTLSIPLIIVCQLEGFWLENDLYAEIPEVTFKQKYLMIAKFDDYLDPIVCSTFMSYKENMITDNCSLAKGREVDTDKDGYIDTLKFELRFFPKFPVKSINLFLFFNYELKKMRKVTMETMALLEYDLIRHSQKIHFSGDLKLVQKNLLLDSELQNIYNYSIDINELSLLQLLTVNDARKLTTRIENSRVTQKDGFSVDEEFVLQAELSYCEEVVNYKPGIWQEMKWIWIQYISFLLIFIFTAKYTIDFLFTNRHIRSYIVVPWEKNK